MLSKRCAVDAEGQALSKRRRVDADAAAAATVDDDIEEFKFNSYNPSTDRSNGFGDERATGALVTTTINKKAPSGICSVKAPPGSFIELPSVGMVRTFTEAEEREGWHPPEVSDEAMETINKSLERHPLHTSNVRTDSWVLRGSEYDSFETKAKETAFNVFDAAKRGFSEKPKFILPYSVCKAEIAWPHGYNCVDFPNGRYTKKPAAAMMGFTVDNTMPSGTGENRYMSAVYYFLNDVVRHWFATALHKAVYSKNKSSDTTKAAAEKIVALANKAKRKMLQTIKNSNGEPTDKDLDIVTYILERIRSFSDDNEDDDNDDNDNDDSDADDDTAQHKDQLDNKHKSGDEKADAAHQRLEFKLKRRVFTSRNTKNWTTVQREEAERDYLDSIADDEFKRQVYLNSPPLNRSVYNDLPLIDTSKSNDWRLVPLHMRKLPQCGAVIAAICEIQLWKSLKRVGIRAVPIAILVQGICPTSSQTASYDFRRLHAEAMQQVQKLPSRFSLPAPVQPKALTFQDEQEDNDVLVEATRMAEEEMNAKRRAAEAKRQQQIQEEQEAKAMQADESQYEPEYPLTQTNDTQQEQEQEQEQEPEQQTAAASSPGSPQASQPDIQAEQETQMPDSMDQEEHQTPKKKKRTKRVHQL
jgi:hypothetical protein